MPIDLEFLVCTRMLPSGLGPLHDVTSVEEAVNVQRTGSSSTREMFLPGKKGASRIGRDGDTSRVEWIWIVHALVIIAVEACLTGALDIGESILFLVFDSRRRWPVFALLWPIPSAYPVFVLRRTSSEDQYTKVVLDWETDRGKSLIVLMVFILTSSRHSCSEAISRTFITQFHLAKHTPALSYNFNASVVSSVFALASHYIKVPIPTIDEEPTYTTTLHEVCQTTRQ
ncbi:hypothetical protein EDD18DRAFT_1100586 [Armillaria luteobubalina]|uniref:Uncharacterized protein n=1 Tax=Armillaria luteobubalina TaxID=153913 RepID=A0AA39UT57_9AGAR|nr:hypothetical protein EDD18DRAFT_1100586 [Armillaria luteobubalina]